MDVIRVMQHIVEDMLDILMPRSVRSQRTCMKSSDEIHLAPERHRLCGQDITALLRYRDTDTQELIQSLKYDASEYAARILAEILADFLYEEVAAARRFAPRRILLSPIPLHRARQHERGFNQIERVLRYLPTEFHDGTLATVTPDIIQRTRATPPQTRLSRAERLRNVKGAFTVVSSQEIVDAHVFIIDDVTTTGATLAEAGKAVSETGARVTLLAFARA